MDHLARDIDALSATSSHAGLAAATQKVLRTMAYYISQSEGAVLEYREEWRDEYTDALYSDSSAAAPSAGGPGLPPRAAERRTASKDRQGGGRSAAAPSRSEAGAMVSASRAEARGRISAAHRGAVRDTAAARPRQADVPPSLRAIMDGSHPSLRGDDLF